MTFGTYNCQTSCFFNTHAKFNIRTTTSHVGGNGHLTSLTSFSNNIRLFLVHFRVQHIVFNTTKF
ncbi:hypothetical protein D3C71_2216920 [compost metagenome]